MKTIIIDGIQYQLTPVNKPKSKEQEMNDFLKPFLTNLTITHNEKHPDSVYYEKNGETLFELYKSKHFVTRKFHVHYDKIWKVFYDRFGLNYDDTQSFIKNVVEDTLKLGDTITIHHSLKYDNPGWKTLTI